MALPGNHGNIIQVSRGMQSNVIVEYGTSNYTRGGNPGGARYTGGTADP
jgi:hypothetical protein